jgi:hypothetical protein
MQALCPFESKVLDAGESRLLERNQIMSIQEVSAERFAQLFHHYHQALADESSAVGKKQIDCRCPSRSP